MLTHVLNELLAVAPVIVEPITRHAGSAGHFRKRYVVEGVFTGYLEEQLDGGSPQLGPSSFVGVVVLARTLALSHLGLPSKLGPRTA